MATNNSVNDGSKTAHGIYVAQGTSTPNYLTLTNGQLLIGSTSSDPVPATLTQGSGVTITTGAGTITIAASGGSGSLTFIASATASSSATIDFANYLTSTYDNYLVTIENLFPASTSYLQLLVGTGSTPTYQSTNYSGEGVSVITGYSCNSTELDLTANGSSANNRALSTTSGRVSGGSVLITNCNNASNDKIVTSSISVFLTTNAIDAPTSFAGRWQSSTVITSLRFLLSTGNISTGTFKLYGYQN